MVRYSPGTALWSDPLSTLRRIQEEMNRGVGGSRWHATTEFPPLNVWRGEGGVLVTAEIPGVSIDDIELTVHQNTLTIKGKSVPDGNVPEESFHRRERHYGPFGRTIALPYGVDSDGVKATTNNGILTIELPRPETEKPKRIEITQG